MKRWHKWTEMEHRFLVENYGLVGDTKLAEIMNKKFPKGYPWTKKHIEKRRNYFGLKRSKDQEHRLRVLNNSDGRHQKMWNTRGRMNEGEIREWKGRKYIKVNGETILLHRYLAGARPGDVVRSHEGMIEIISRKENQRRNIAIRLAQPEELRKTVKALNKLKNILNGKENRRFKGNTV